MDAVNPPTPSPVDRDRALVAAAADGDGGAYDNWAAGHRAALTRFAAQHLGEHRNEAEDVVQDAFVRAWVALRDGRVPDNPRAWIYTIVRHRAWDVRTARGRAEGVALTTELAAGGDGPAELAGRREGLDSVVAAMHELPASQRDALAGSAFEGLSYDEIAARQDVTVSAVKQLIYRARRGLQAVRPACHALGAPLVALRESTLATLSQQGASVGAVAVIAVSGVPPALPTLDMGTADVGRPAAPQTAAVARGPAKRAAAPVPAPDRPIHRAAQPRDVLRACAAGAPLRGFDRVTLARALRDMEVDVAEYSGCTDAIRAAQWRAPEGG